MIRFVLPGSLGLVVFAPSLLLPLSWLKEGLQRLLLAEDVDQLRVDPIQLPIDKLREVPEASEVQGRW